MNRLPQDYGSDRLIAALTELDWATNAVSGAIHIIQATATEWFRESLADDDAVWILGSLLDRRLIRTEVHPNESAWWEEQKTASAAASNTSGGTAATL